MEGELASIDYARSAVPALWCLAFAVGLRRKKGLARERKWRRSRYSVFVGVLPMTKGASRSSTASLLPLQKSRLAALAAEVLAYDICCEVTVAGLKLGMNCLIRRFFPLPVVWRTSA